MKFGCTISDQYNGFFFNFKIQKQNIGNSGIVITGQIIHDIP